MNVGYAPPISGHDNRRNEFPAQLSTAMATRLHGRTRYVAPRTEHAAIATLGFEQRAASWTFPEKLAGIGRHA
jgi:hypothetical protein